MHAAVGSPQVGRPKVVAGLRLVRLVGQGGEGEVWETRDEAGRRRALKLIRPDMLAAPAEVRRRGAYLERIDHPALVAVHRSGRLAGSTLEGWGFVDMAFVDGESLTSAPADPATLERLRPLAHALDLLHAGTWSDGIPLVHRDIKPANLLAAPDGHVVLVDCSTLRGADATEFTRIGTPVYAAPEVFTGRVGPAADLYSFAVTVVALSTGARGPDLVQLLEDPWTLDLPPAVGWALSPHPADRPLSCREVLDAGATIHLPADRLAELQAAEAGPGAHRAPPRRRVWPWITALAGVLAAVVVPAEGLVGVDVPVGLAAAAALHVSAQLLAGRRLLPAVALPPVAWAFLLADRAGGPLRVTSWLRATLTGVLTAGAVALTLELQGDTGVPSLAVAGGAVGATALAGISVRSRGAAGVLLRLLLAPAWAVGAALLVAGMTLGLPFAATVGQGRDAMRLAGHTAASLACFLAPTPSVRIGRGRPSSASSLP